MQAVRAHAFGPPDVLALEALPVPRPGPGELVVRVESASVNFSDVMRRRAEVYPLPTTLPFTPGSEVAGTVAALGDGVAGPPVGTPVFALVGTGDAIGTGGYAQYAVADAARAAPIPPGLDADTACGLFVAGLTALLVLRDVARLRAGERVLVQAAAGAVGGYAVQIARHLGAGVVVGLASGEAKRAAALAAGATHAVDPAAPDWPGQVLELTGGRGVDVVLEMSGGPSLERSLACLAPFGRAVVYGRAANAPLRLSDAAVERFFYAPAPNQSLHAFNVGGWFVERPAAAGEALGVLAGLVAGGAVRPPATSRLPLAAAAEAHRRLEGRLSAGKTVLRPWDAWDGAPDESPNGNA